MAPRALVMAPRALARACAPRGRPERADLLLHKVPRPGRRRSAACLGSQLAACPAGQVSPPRPARPARVHGGGARGTKGGGGAFDPLQLLPSGPRSGPPQDQHRAGRARRPRRPAPGPRASRRGARRARRRPRGATARAGRRGGGALGPARRRGPRLGPPQDQRRLGPPQDQHRAALPMPAGSRGRRRAARRRGPAQRPGCTRRGARGAWTGGCSC
jgi:hypothetical protein